MRQVVAMVLGIAAAAAAMAQEPAMVQMIYACDEATSRSTFAAMQRANVDLTGAMEMGSCIRLPVPVDVAVVEIVAGPAKDFEGDWMYLVRVGTEAYTVAWPGFNTTIPAPSGA